MYTKEHIVLFLEEMKSALIHDKYEVLKGTNFTVVETDSYLYGCDTMIKVFDSFYERVIESE